MKEGMDRVARASFEAAGTPAARFYLGVMDHPRVKTKKRKFYSVKPVESGPVIGGSHKLASAHQIAGSAISLQNMRGAWYRASAKLSAIAYIYE